MQRHVSLDEISDGKLYDLNDLVKAGCGDCGGCSACCRGMGSSILLDPLDVHRLCSHLGVTFEQLLADRVELNVSDGLILPNLKMSGPSESCGFLDSEGRCSVHPFRPGFCRLFPLGRYYEDRSFRYFLQIHECKKENRAKIKVKKWIDTPDPKKYETFVCDWHYFLKDLQEQLPKPSGQQTNAEPQAKTVSLYLLRNFYMTPYQAEHDFYLQFYERLKFAKAALLPQAAPSVHPL